MVACKKNAPLEFIILCIYSHLLYFTTYSWWKLLIISFLMQNHTFATFYNLELQINKIGTFFSWKCFLIILLLKSKKKCPIKKGLWTQCYNLYHFLLLRFYVKLILKAKNGSISNFFYLVSRKISEGEKSLDFHTA